MSESITNNQERFSGDEKDITEKDAHINDFINSLNLKNRVVKQKMAEELRNLGLPELVISKQLNL